MKFARIVFSIAAAYGFLVFTSLYFLIDKVGRNTPPPVTHPEFYYGFVGLGFLCQCIFVLIAFDPLRYRPVMLLAVLEKVAYTLPVVILYLHGRTAESVLVPSLVDPALGILFVIAYLRTRKTPRNT